MRRFRYLTLADLKLGFDDLFTKRVVSLDMSSLGKPFKPLLAAKHAAVNALPEALTGGKPLADALNETDDVHDGFGHALWHLTEAYLQLPEPNATVVAAISRIRAGLIPQRGDLRESYADEAEAATRRYENLSELEADLKSIPVAMGGSTLYDWTLGYLNAGRKLGTLLSARADLSGSGRTGASKLRVETIGLLNRVRQAIADESQVNALPADIDTQIWGYFDELEAHRAAAVRGRDENGSGGT